MHSFRTLALALKKTSANSRVIWFPFLLKWLFGWLAAQIILRTILRNFVVNATWTESTGGIYSWFFSARLVVMVDLAALSGFPWALDITTRPSVGVVAIIGPLTAGSCLLVWVLDAAILVALERPVLGRRSLRFFRDGLAFAGRLIRAGVLQLVVATVVFVAFNLAANPNQNLWMYLLAIFTVALVDLWGDYTRGLIVADRLTSVSLASLSALRFLLGNWKSTVLVGSVKAVQWLLIFWVFSGILFPAAIGVPLVIWLYTLTRALHYAAVLSLFAVRPKKVELYTD